MRRSLLNKRLSRVLKATFSYLVISPMCSYLCIVRWELTQPIGLLSPVSACSRSVMEMSCSSKCSSSASQDSHIFTSLCVYVGGWLCADFCLKWQSVVCFACLCMCVCLNLPANTHRDTDLSHPVCVISHNNDTLWLIEFLICLLTCLAPILLMWEKKGTSSVCVCVCVYEPVRLCTQQVIFANLTQQEAAS